MASTLRSRNPKRRARRRGDLAVDGHRVLQGYERPLRGDPLEVRLVELTRGHFLAADMDIPWTFSMREGLRSRMLQLVSSLGCHWEEAGELRKAAGLYLQGLETDDLVEEFYQRLMVCHHKLGDQGAVASLWKRCRTTLAMLGVKPSAATRSIYEVSVQDPS